MLTDWGLPLHSFLIWLPVGALLIHRGDRWDSLQRQEKPWVPGGSQRGPTCTATASPSQRGFHKSMCQLLCSTKAPFRHSFPKQLPVRGCRCLWCYQENFVIQVPRGRTHSNAQDRHSSFLYEISKGEEKQPLKPKKFMCALPIPKRNTISAASYRRAQRLSHKGTERSAAPQGGEPLGASRHTPCSASRALRCLL